MDNQIRRIRVIPPKFTEVGFGHIFVGRYNKMVGDLFFALYKKYGRPDGKSGSPFKKPDGAMKYVFRCADVVTEVMFEPFEVKTYIAPSYRQEAEKKRVKMLNIIVRDANIGGVPYVGEDVDKLYYAVKQRNTQLIENSGKADVELREQFKKKVGEQIARIDGGLEQYIPEVEAIFRNFTERIVCM